MGALRLRVRLHDLQRGADQSQAVDAPSVESSPRPAKAIKQSAEKSAQQVFHASPGIELDLRGQRVDEALSALENYLDQAFLAGLPSVRIIHGMGTGAVRQAVRKALRHARQVKTWKVGTEGEGGDGVTVAYLDVD